MGTRDARIDAYISTAQPFAKPILTHLRDMVHAGCPEVEETLKWSVPHFQYKGTLAGMAAFKGHCRFGFWKGSLLNNGAKEGGAAFDQFGRIMSIDDLPSDRQLIKLVKQAAALNEQGVKVQRMKKAPRAPLRAPAYFMTALTKNKKAAATFQAFSPSHKREYIEWITGAKAEGTRTRRLETAIAWIAEGKPRNWKYM
jgi:hypothetical protein